MIDVASLRLLGWSEELISEVTRTADGLNGMSVGVGNIFDQAESRMSLVVNNVIFDSNGQNNQSRNCMAIVTD